MPTITFGDHTKQPLESCLILSSLSNPASMCFTSNFSHNTLNLNMNPAAYESHTWASSPAGAASIVILKFR